MSYPTFIEINGYQYDAIAEYAYHPKENGAWEAGGQQIDPDIPAYIEITSIKLDFNKDGKYIEIDLPDEVLGEIATEILAEYQ